MRVTILATTAMVGLCFVVVCASSGRLKGRVTDKQSGEPVIGASVSVVGTPMGARTDVDGKYQILRIEPGVYSLRISQIDYLVHTVDSLVIEEGATGERNIVIERSSVDLIKTIEVRADQDLIDPFGMDCRTSIDAEANRTRPTLLGVDVLLNRVPRKKTDATGEVFIRGGRAGEISCMYFFPLPSPLDFLASSPFDVDQASPPGSSIQGVTILRRSDVQPHDDEFAPITPLEFSLDFTKSRPLHSKH